MDVLQQSRFAVMFGAEDGAHGGMCCATEDLPISHHHHRYEYNQLIGFDLCHISIAETAFDTVEGILPTLECEPGQGEMVQKRHQWPPAKIFVEIQHHIISVLPQKI